MLLKSLPPVAFLAAVAAADDTRRVSVDSAGTEGNGSVIFGCAIATDGSSVAFSSYASNLYAGDVGHADTFVHDRATGLTEHVSVDPSGAPANNDSWNPALNGDGQVVAFHTHASNLVAGDTNGWSDVFVRDRASGLTTRVSVDSAGIEGNFNSFHAALSADGQIVAFHSDATNLVPGDANLKTDVFVHDRTTGITTRVSVDSTGAEGNGLSFLPALSADGNLVAFHSSSSNLVAGDTNGSYDVFVHDRSTGATTRVSVDSSGAEGNNHSMNAALSADGVIVAYDSWSDDLVASDTNFRQDVFVHDRATGVTTRASVDSSGVQGNDHSVTPAISSDGSLVAFDSFSSNLVAGDGNATNDVFVHDRATGATERVSVSSAGAEANGICQVPEIAGDGRTIAFRSSASNLVGGDTNGTDDVFVREHCADARWTNYGKGLAGTLGIPGLTAQADPVLGTTITIDVGNSLGAATSGFLVFGLQRARLPFKGGELLVVPLAAAPLAIPAAGLPLTEDLPDDEALCGVEVVAQVLEADSGAPKKTSFTKGLALLLGR